MAEGGIGSFCLSETKDTTASYSGFLSAVYVWIKKPHVINKRLLYADVQHSNESAGVVELRRDIIPKSNAHKPGSDSVVIDSVNCTVTFTPHGDPKCDYISYQFKYESSNASDTESRISLLLFPLACLEKNMGVVHPKSEWLKSTLFPKICKWAEQSIDSDTLAKDEVISMKRYCTLYKELKLKHGPYLIDNWIESTDPYKFVYEDIAIATYLLVLWEEERERCGLSEKQSFVDIGCGNGLLVYILSSEGHRGKGIDLRDRRIWKLLSPVAKLEVMTLTPSNITCFPEYDWLIGNHSDELTPWIPVMAARSSYHTRYFVIPCCSFDFDKKYCRPTSNCSQYRCYLNYISEIGISMGFVVNEDVLRIPSSKRVCLIGSSRTYLPHEECYIEEKRTLFIKSRCSSTKSDPNDEHLHDDTVDFDDSSYVSHDESCDRHSVKVWAENFKPRPTLESVKNCTQVQRCVQERIVAMVTRALLDGPPEWVTAVTRNDTTKLWNKGRSMELSDLADMLGDELLLSLKKECGGLHTLLRNYCQIFEVHRGVVEIRDWSKTDKPLSARYKSRLWKQNEFQLLYKTKLCWFHQNHPQGCPRSSGDCPYAHGAGELRERPDFKNARK